MNAVSSPNRWLFGLVALAGNAYAVESPNPAVEQRVAAAELVAVVDAIEPFPRTDREFAELHRVSARIAGVLKGDARAGERVEILIDRTISEHATDCCAAGRAYVVFLRKREGRYLFVGSPLGAIPLELQSVE
ncbi:hypothetical protein H0E84_15105 [Luteimonas sp. SJ-92]|uniref:Uncharacterized protein n=1 Tax=Luteimonas salinisoli TaxID=2752307 RepID=A0A853JH04_9GAMM|nr:hypothetical protein [Luteimonas salinisoli]NZA27708.1 hypothetical protein [Luteimonas salinisoli]